MGFGLCYNPCSCIQEIIRHEVGIPSLRKLLRKLLIPFCLLPASLILLSCGGSTSGSSTKTSGLAYRAFLSNSVSSGSSGSGLYIVDATRDVRALGVPPIAAGSAPGMMVVTPNRANTLVYSGTNLVSPDNQFSIINNAAEANAAHLTLPGYTESFVVSPDSSMAYIAVPNAPVVNQSQGAIEIVAISAASLRGEIDIPSVHYLSIDNGGDRLLAFSSVLAQLGSPCLNQTPSFLFVVVPSNIGSVPCPVIPVPGFDQPVQAFFSPDDTTAYVVNCGAECGGKQASVQPFDLTTCSATTYTCGAPGVAVPVPAASVALLDGSTMYLAGTPYSGGSPSQPCTGQTTAATTCGLLTVLDLGTMSTNASPIVITDGHHNRIAMGANGQLFVGARTCTEIIPAQPPPTGAEVRGCLSIYNTLSTMVGTNPPGGVLIPPETGDVTGIQPIANRQVVYVVQGASVQGGTLYIYDDTIDTLEYNPNDPNNRGQIFGLVGNFYDVKTIDF